MRTATVQVALAIACSAQLAAAAAGSKPNTVAQTGAPIPVQGGLGSLFPLQAPPALTEFQAGSLLNFTFSSSRRDLRGAPVPDQAIVSGGAGIKGSREVAMSYDTSTFSSQFSSRVGGSIGFKYISAGASYGEFVQGVSSSTKAAYQSATHLAVSVQTVRVTQPTRVTFIPEVEAALKDLNAAFSANGTAAKPQFFEFFHKYDAHFVSEYTYGGFADFSVVSTGSNTLRTSTEAQSFGTSVGLAFKGIGLSVNTQRNVSSSQYAHMMQASSQISVNCQGGQVGLCASALELPPFGAQPNTTLPVEQWAVSVTSDNRTATSFVTRITSIADVLRQRDGMFQLGNAMDDMFVQYAAQCPSDADDVSICSGHGTCEIFPSGARCRCLADSGGESYVGEYCSCPGSSAGGACSGHGTCNTGPDANGPGQCECDHGYSGAACDKQACPTDPYFEAAGPCGGHGQCSDMGTCVCDPGWRGPACTVPCGDNGSEDLFSLRVDGSNTWGHVATSVNVELINGNQDDDGEWQMYELWRGAYNGQGEVGFRPATADTQYSPGNSTHRKLNSNHDYGWLIPMFWTEKPSGFPTPWNRDFSTPGDAICQLVFTTWLKTAFQNGAFPSKSEPPAVTKMSVFSSRSVPPQIYDKAEGENHYSAMPSTSYVDTTTGNPFMADPNAQRSFPTYVHHFDWNHYPGLIYCFAQCPQPPANY